jgi:3-oxoadipate enol-lactonase
MKTTVGSTTLAYHVLGKGDGVLLIHGFPLSRKMWDPVLDPLAIKNRLIVPDLRGHGESPATAAVTISDMASDMAAILDAAGEKRPVVVVGLSMGGYVALEFFRAFRKRVRALVLADTRAGRDSPEGLQSRYAMIETARRQGSRAVAELQVRRLFSDAAPEGVRHSWLSVMEANPVEGMVAALQAMAQRPDFTALLQSIDCPTLILVGKDDAITPPQEARSMQAAIRGAKLAVIEGAGHLTPIEKPEEFGALVRQFIDDLPPLDAPPRPVEPESPRPHA